MRLPVLRRLWAPAGGLLLAAPDLFFVHAGDSVAFRALTGAILMMLFRESGAAALAALAAAAGALWTPGRADIQTLAFPAAAFALFAARRAVRAERPLPWDAAALVTAALAFSESTRFTILVPALVLLRLQPGTAGLRRTMPR